MKTPELNKIIEIVQENGIHPLKIRNVYVFGSRVYGYNNEESDFDIIMVAPNLEKNKEIKHPEYNIHVINPNDFKEEIFKNYKITYLECLFAPDWAKLLEKINYEFIINKDKLKSEFIVQSFSAWKKGKLKMKIGDLHRGVKSAFHALRILYFGIQLIEHNKITNFAECNDLYKEMNDENFYEWFQIRDKYLEKKKELENKLKLL